MSNVTSKPHPAKPDDTGVDWARIFRTYEHLDNDEIGAILGLPPRIVKERRVAAGKVVPKTARKLSARDLARFRRMYESGVTADVIERSIGKSMSTLRNFVGSDWVRGIPPEPIDDRDARVVDPTPTSSVDEWLKKNKPQRLEGDELAAYNSRKVLFNRGQTRPPPRRRGWTKT